MKYVVFYEIAPDTDDLLVELLPAHRARWEGYLAQGTLLAIGPFSDRTGALGVFSTREAAEEYAAGDPFVQHGVVRSWSIREWNEVLL
jgi:uncharacterized protein